MKGTSPSRAIREAETGIEVPRWEVRTLINSLGRGGHSVKHFTSRLGLCPGIKIAGGKVMSGKTKRCVNRASQALRLAAAHKLARLIYTMLTKGQEYTDQGQDYYEERYRERVLRALSQRATKLGLKMVPNEQPS
jgi:transposase